MSAVVSTVALNVQSDGSVAVKIDVVPSSRAPSPLLEMLGGAAAEATNLALAFVDDAAEATSAVASAGAALAGTAETLFDAAADRVDADVASTIRVFNPFMAMAMSGFNAFVDNAASGALTAHVGAIVTATTTATTARVGAYVDETMKNVDATVETLNGAAAATTARVGALVASAEAAADGAADAADAHVIKPLAQRGAAVANRIAAVDYRQTTSKAKEAITDYAAVGSGALAAAGGFATSLWGRATAAA